MNIFFKSQFTMHGHVSVDTWKFLGLMLCLTWAATAKIDGGAKCLSFLRTRNIKLAPVPRELKVKYGTYISNFALY